MLFIKNWDKASLDKSSNSIVAKYKNKINSLTDKTEALRKLLGELYDEALILNERIKIDKQAIQEDLNDTADDLRETCGNSSWGQDELKDAQDLLDRAEEDIEDIKTDVEITTGCLVVCQSGQGSGGCNQLPTPDCNEGICLIGNAPDNCVSGNCTLNDDDDCSTEQDTGDGDCTAEDDVGDCVVLVDGEFICTGNDSTIDNCYGGCYNNQSCDSQTKVCPKCHGSEVDIIETCTECDTDQKETCGAVDSQAGCETRNETGNCTTLNSTGDCSTSNDVGDCSSNNDAGDCTINNKQGTCTEKVDGNCDTDNGAEDIDKDDYDCTRFNSNDEKVCKSLNRGDSDCISNNIAGNCNNDNNNLMGNCTTENNSGNCVHTNDEGSCQYNDNSQVCNGNNTDQRTCTKDDVGADYCIEKNSTSSDCNTNNSNNDCNGFNSTGNCTSFNETGDCYENNSSGNCTTNNETGSCDTQSCEAGQECTECVTDQKESTTTEKCQAGANIGDEEYCDTCQGDESKVEEWDQEELEDLCSTIFKGGADACGPAFADCFNASECDGASWGAAAGCGTGQGCGTCNENDTCSGGQECATGQTCTNNDCGQDCGQDCGESPSCGTCVNGQGSCWPLHDCVEGQGGCGQCALVVVGEPGTCDSSQSND